MSSKQWAATENEAGLILVGVDGSEASISALHWALAEAGRTGAGVEAVYVYADVAEPLYASGRAGLPPLLPPSRAAVTRSAEEELARVVSRAVGDDASSNSLTTAVVEGGSPAAALSHLGRHADLLVVGAHRATGIGRLFGSTTAGVLRHAPCPVLVVPGPELSQQQEKVGDALATR